MAPASTSSPARDVPADWPRNDMAWTDYLRWLTAIAGGQIEHDEGTLKLSFTDDDPSDQRVETIDAVAEPVSDVLQWLSARIDELGHPLMARPLERPLALHEITPKLFEAYQVDDGQMHVSGCRIEDRPFVVVSCVAADDQPPRVVQFAFDPEGQPVDHALVERLGLFASSDCGVHPPRVSPYEAQRARQSAATAMADRGEVHSVVLVLPRWASGAVEFESGESQVRVTFADWAAGLTPPPIIGPETGEPTYHLATTTDGRLAAIEQLATCSVTGNRWLCSELVTCASTGKLIEEALTVECPVTGERSHKDAFGKCSWCQQQVSQATLAGGVCGCCRSLAAASRTDRPISDILARHPRLARYRRFKAGQSRDVVIVEAVGLWNRLLIVLDGETTKIRHIGSGTRLTRQWVTRHANEFASLLGSGDG